MNMSHESTILQSRCSMMYSNRLQIRQRFMPLRVRVKNLAIFAGTRRLYDDIYHMIMKPKEQIKDEFKIFRGPIWRT